MIKTRLKKGLVDRAPGCGARFALALSLALLFSPAAFAETTGSTSARDSLDSKSDGSAQQAGMLSNAGMIFTTTGTALLSTVCCVAAGKVMIGLGVASYAAGMIRMSESGDARRNSDLLADQQQQDLCALYNVCPPKAPDAPPTAPDAPGSPTRSVTHRGPESPVANMARDDLNRLKNELEKAGIRNEGDRQKAIAAGLAAQDSLGGGDPMALLSPEQKAEFEAAMKAAAARYGVSGVDTEGAGGAGGLARGKGGVNKDDMDLMALFGKPEDGRSPATAEGLSKNFNGDPIGVAQDDIFKQVTRRYDAKKKSGQFISVNDSATPGARKPNALLGPLKQKRH